jgi:twitching motility two-component system response regulator PilH
MATILIVDDSPTERHVLKTILEKYKINLIFATNGEEGVAMAKATPPDLILMDVVMPGLNGFQSTRLLSKTPETAAIPVIMVSTKDQETDKIWGMRQGAKGYLTKPVQEAELIGVIREFIQV